MVGQHAKINKRLPDNRLMLGRAWIYRRDVVEDGFNPEELFAMFDPGRLRHETMPTDNPFLNIQVRWVGAPRWFERLTTFCMISHI